MYSTRTKQIYIRKVFPHDLTHEVSVTKEVVNEFFEGGNQLTFYKGENHETRYTVTINNATDPRFGGDFASLWSADQLNVNDLIIIKKLSSREYELTTTKNGTALYQYMEHALVGNQRHAVLVSDEIKEVLYPSPKIILSNTKYRPYITAIKSKPFLLLAGISGTGKSRIVRELARACWEEGSEEYKAHKPRNFEMVQVKPNWHDSSELLGYVSRIGADKDGNGVTFIAGDFLKFIAKAWEEPDVPYFLCLDEMNLAPVEQYFAEYLSVVESRKATEEGVVSDPILKVVSEQWYIDLVGKLTRDAALQEQFLHKGICIPQNLIVIGTVNMDETTFSFSRKVLDRAMTIEMNEVDLGGGLTDRYEKIGKLGASELVGTCVEGVDVYSSHKGVCDRVIAYLKVVNEKLEGTPFKIAYRTRNEFLLYVVNNLPYNKDEDGKNITQDFVVARALDEITNMKVLSRVEGDETKVSEKFLKGLSDAIKEQLGVICNNLFNTENPEKEYKSMSLAKLEEMIKKLASGYTSFWS